jgi:hypothetical protein
VETVDGAAAVKAVFTTAAHTPFMTMAAAAVAVAIAAAVAEAMVAKAVGAEVPTAYRFVRALT